ncbi:MAG: response regulator [Bacteroidales bacterium]|nr:response regulator [Bacteroidales bacterium]MCM1415683.1 response regulator [bacterium]MCM1424468.1 response regulator [bacterium]
MLNGYFFTGGAVAVALIGLLMAGVIVVLLLRYRWNRRLLAAAEEAKRRLEDQYAIVAALSRDYLNIYAVRPRQADGRVIKLEGYVTTGITNDTEKYFPYEASIRRYVEERVYPEDREALERDLALPVVTEKLQSRDEYTGSYRVLADGEVQNFQFTYVKMEKDDPAEEFEVLLGFRNVDDLVKKEQEQKEILAEALAEAQHANHAKTTFLNNMSHDIRTPMNAIIGFTSLAAAHIDSRDLVQSYLDKIMTSSRHLLSLINDVLDMSRIESGKVNIEEKEASLPEILHDIKTIIQADIKAKQLEFYIDTLDVVNEWIICDKLRLNQVLLNILSNSMKYTKPGGTVSVRIIQKADSAEGYASYQFIIKDTGIGMSEEFLKHIFEPFEREQTATVSGIQGTGLGLAITKNIIDMMNGTVSVKSEAGKGTEFTVSFRFRVAGDPEKAEVPEELVDLRALIADDDVNTCMSVSKMLTAIGMHPDWTTQGKEAVIRAEFAVEQHDPYSVYIIDWLMPDMNGIEVVRRIRKVVGDAARIIILTAYDWSDIEEEAREAGVTAFCAKPIFLSELREILISPRKDTEKAEQEESPAETFIGRKLLLAEDNEINQEIAKAILEEAGFVLDVVDDGTQAVEAVKNAPARTYDLVLMDIQMPIMNGYEATRQIRALGDPEKAGVPIVAMTANAFEEDRQMAMEVGMNGHVAKPIDVPQLLETLKNLLAV